MTLRGFLLFLYATLAASAWAETCPRNKTEAATWAKQQATALSANLSAAGIRAAGAALAGCQSEIAAIAGGSVCLDPLRRFTVAQDLEHQAGHSLGTTLADGVFLKSSPFPEMMELPPELREQDFLQLLDANDRKSLDAAQDHIASINSKISDPALKWQVFEYVSQHLYTPDSRAALGRFFVYIPGPDYDRYLQFGLRDKPTNPIPFSVSIVAIRKTDPATHSTLAAPEAWLIDLWRKHEPNGEYTLTTRYAMQGGMENCYACHKSAVLPITPNPTSFDSARYGKTVAFVNKMMASYGHVEMAGQDMKGYGPGMGPLQSPVRTDAFLTKCASAVTDPARRSRLKDLMKCQRCHDGDTRGLLNYPTGRVAAAPAGISLIEDYVVRHQLMPPGAHDLTGTERSALYECLREEYYNGFGSEPGLLQSWLSNQTCWTQ